MRIFVVAVAVKQREKLYLYTIELHYRLSETNFLFAGRCIGLLYYNFCCMVLLKDLSHGLTPWYLQL